MRWRVTIGMVLITLLGLCSADDLSLIVPLAASASRQIDQDPISQYEQQFRGLRTQLPAHGAFGYRDDKPVAPGDELAVQRYLVAQYALAPLILDPVAYHPLVIHNCATGVRLACPEPQ